MALLGTILKIVGREDSQLKRYYIDDEMEISFSISPSGVIRERIPICIEDRADIIKHPIWNTRDIVVTVFDYKKKKRYDFLIEKHTKSDGATIPRFAWSLIGVTPTDNRIIVGAFIHDYLCTHKSVINNDRKLSTLILDKCCIVGGLNCVQRFLIKFLLIIIKSFVDGK